MADGLIPNLAPNLYSQGQAGTGYAQVFDLGALNPFAVTQDYINQTIANKKQAVNTAIANKKEDINATLANKKEEINAILANEKQALNAAVADKKEAVKAAIANEEKRQQKLDEFLSSIDDIDQPWNVAKVEIGNAINDYGDKIASMRAQGTPINSSELMKAQKNLKNLAKVNESNYQKAMKIGTEMQNPLIYTDEEREQFQQSIKDAADLEKKGSVQKVQEVLDQWQKSVETPNVVEDYKKIKPVSKDETGYVKKTTEDDFNKAVKGLLTSYQKPQLKKLLKMYQDENRITSPFTSEDIDANNQAVLDAIEIQMKDDLQGQKELDVTPMTITRTPDTPEEKRRKSITLRAAPKYGKGYNESITIGDVSRKPMEFELSPGNLVNIMPGEVAPIGANPDGSKIKDGFGNEVEPGKLYIIGKQVAAGGDKGYFTTKEEAQSELQKTDAVGTIEEYQDEDGSKKYRILSGAVLYIPLDEINNARFSSQSGGIDLRRKYSQIYGGSKEELNAIFGNTDSKATSSGSSGSSDSDSSGDSGDSGVRWK
jgi:hypothetical protein